jgi:uncharacterized protein YvpB
MEKSGTKMVPMNRSRLSTFTLLSLLIFSILAPSSQVLAEDIPDSAYIDNFYGSAQYYNLSCEVRSAADVAGFWGITISEDAFFDLLPVSDNPNKGFVGYRNDYWGNIPPASYGVHAEPIAKVLRDLGLKAHAEEGIEVDDVKSEIAAGHPVIVWIIGQMWQGYASRIEFKDGEQGLVAAHEHTMVVTGYGEGTIQLFNPYTGSYESYSQDAFETSWEVLGNMAVTVTGTKDGKEAETTPEATATATPANWPSDAVIYTVQQGDYLIELGKRYGVDWRWLVEINQIPYPWTLFPGQQIRVK